ncbi:hypothetical protein HYH02_007601 [Chlamydomonas schloesseri]|uniref:Myb-like domain-containing protein n=1 Tax=Chlamydomonas schloesseri TaxID=2026947 RepID=A0A835WHI0_9CHLO|nr:hypothetical protein HYH02_007601 [Chlamydomonas schloesseri]|eukprot:KAG2447271.1 hypothetical protein HYH02_007601 [Chlamydomonas schloesseri]
MAKKQYKQIRFKLKLGTGVDWEALGPIPEPFPLCIDAGCTTLCFKQFLSNQILDGVFDPSSLRLRLEGCARELEDTANADGPTTSTYQPKLLRLAEQGVCNGSVVQLDVCATEEEVQRYHEEAEARAEANEVADLEAAAAAYGAAVAGERQPQAATPVAAAAAGGEGPDGRPSLDAAMHTPAGTVGTFVDDDDEDEGEGDQEAAAYLQEGPQAEEGQKVLQGGQQQQPHRQHRKQGRQQQEGQRQWQHGEGQGELGDLNVAPEGEPLQAEDGEEEEEEQQWEQARGQRCDAAAAVTGAASGKWLRRRQLDFQDQTEGEEDSGLGLRQPAPQPTSRPPTQAAAAVRQQQPEQQPRPGARAHAPVGKRPRGAPAVEEFDFVSDSDDQGAEPPRQQQRTNGGAAVAAASRGAAGLPVRGAAGAAGPPSARLQPQPQPHPAPARSVGLPPSMQPAVDTGAFTGYGRGGVASPGKERATSSFWTLEEIVRLVDYVEAHGAKLWSNFLDKDPMNRTVEQVKMRWRNLKANSEKGWQEMRRVNLPVELRRRIDLIVRKTG